MDPRSKSYNRVLDVDFAIEVIDRWLAKGHLYYWDKSPDVVKAELASVEGRLLYGKAVEILRSAETCKMPGHANAGMAWIRQTWAGK